MGYPEQKDPRTGKAPRHQAAAEKTSWKEISNAVILPLTTENEGAPKMMKGALAMIDPIKQILDIRNIKYEEKYAFIREALQNINRSRGEEGHNMFPDVDIQIDPSYLMIKDNAGGITANKIAKLFDFGHSGWEGSAVKENPFGQGFLSFCILFDRIEVYSNNVHVVFDLSEILSKRDAGILNLNEAYDFESGRSYDTFGRGEFALTCSKPLEYWDVEDARDMAIKSGTSLPIKSLTINGENIELVTFKTPHGARYIDITKYNSKGEKVIEGFIEVTGDVYFDKPDFYYYGLIVGRYGELPGMRGSVNIIDKRYGKPLEDRGRWQQSKKGTGVYLAQEHIEEYVKNFIAEIIQYGTDAEIEKFSKIITDERYIGYETYKKDLKFSLIGNNTIQAISDGIRKENPDISEEKFNEELKEQINTKSKLKESAEKTIRSESEIADEYNRKREDVQKRRGEINDKKFEADHVEIEIIKEEEEVLDQEEIEIQKKEDEAKKEEERRKRRIEEGVVKFSDIKKTTFWARIEEVPSLSDLIKNAEYHGYQIAIAHNSVQARMFEKEQIDMNKKTGKFLHVGLFKYVSTNFTKMKKIGPKNKEEARIEWTINTFINSVPEFEKVNFHIADYDFMTVMRIPGTDIEETIKTGAIAYAYGNDVYMMREIGYGDSIAGETQGIYGAKSLKPYLRYNNFPLENKTIGWGDIALFLRVVNLIAHEMAHSIYNTTDNTQEHFEAMGRIIAKFNSVITEYQGRTVLGKGSDMGVKNRRAIDVEKDDTVAITYFTGTDVEMEESEIKPQSVKKVKSFKDWDFVLHNELAAYVESVETDFYTVRYLTGPDAGSGSIKIPKSEAVEYPFKKGRLYKDPSNDDTYFITGVTYTPWDYWDNGIRYIKFMGFNDNDVKSEEFLSTHQAITIGLKQYNKKEQAEFIHNIAVGLINERMESYGYVSIPYLVDYFQPILPINFQTIQYIIRDKYTDKYEKMDSLTYDGAEQYYFK